MANNIFRIGDPESMPDQAIEIAVKTSKATAIVRPHPMKKFTKREVGSAREGGMEWEQSQGSTPDQQKLYIELKRRTEYMVRLPEAKDSNEVEENEDNEEGESHKPEPTGEIVEKETLVKAFKYGSTWVPCEEGHFDGLHTRKGIEVHGFIPESTVSTLLVCLV